MIQTRISVGTDIAHFTCEQCFAEEVAYTEMPMFCYHCNCEFFFDALALQELLEARQDYYERGMTLLRRDYA